MLITISSLSKTYFIKHTGKVQKKNKINIKDLFYKTHRLRQAFPVILLAQKLNFRHVTAFVKQEKIRRRQCFGQLVKIQS